MPRKANKIHLYPSNEKDDFYENGVVGLAGLAADIPDHKRVEQALRQQAQIIDQIHDSVVSTDLDGHVIRWNRGAERLFGYTSKEAVGKHISFVYPEDQRDFLQHQVIRPLKEKGEHDIEVRMHRKSGEKFDAHLSLSLLRDDQGGIIGMIGYSIDITDRKQAQEALQKAHDALEIRVLERTAALVEANAALQAEIAERRRVEKQIKARTRQQEAVAMLGQQALEGKPLSELMKEAVSLVARVLEVEYAKVLELLPGGKAFLLRAGVGWKEGIVGNEIVDAGIDSQAGYTFALLSKAPVIVEDLRAEARFTAPPLLRDHAVVSGMSTVIYGREFPIGVLGAHTVRRRKFTKNDSHFLQSIANVLAQAIDRNRSEEERARLLANEHQARRDAEEANRAKDDFLAMVSHELRTPLNSIMGWAQILQRGEVDQATYRIALKSIGGNAKAQAQLIEDLLDVSRIIAGNLRLDLRVTSLPPMIEAAIDSVRPAAEAKGIRIETTLAPAADTVLADPDRLQQVVTNLLSNAIKFTPEGGRVRVDLERVNPAIQIRVSDTGIGISAEFLPYVFDRFRQAKSAGSRAREGLGLGLAIVRHLVELHGGT
ncbi:MAG: PAS domain S-box protein, partial [Candidatus Manganitrophaceae bacterium]